MPEHAATSAMKLSLFLYFLQVICTQVIYAILKQKAMLSLQSWHCSHNLRTSCDKEKTCIKNNNEQLKAVSDSFTKYVPFRLFNYYLNVSFSFVILLP